jgi:predicted nucleotidyltransferase component of viral defense system
MAEKNLGASVHSKLKNKAQAENKELNLILTRYALERFLYRLSISEHRDHFLLKGALLFDLWFDVPLRATRDIDLLGFQLPDAAYLLKTFEDLSDIEVEDGMTFDRASIRAEEIRKEAHYSGMRVTLAAYLDGARSIVKVDVGYGDAVTPAPEVADYPVLLDEFPNPRLRVYPRYTVVAEKLDAIISLGMANSRMKDYFDIWVILRESELDLEVLRSAVSATIKRRNTMMPEGLPLGLSDDFAKDKNKNIQWNTFLSKNQLGEIPLNELVIDLRRKLEYLFVK